MDGSFTIPSLDPELLFNLLAVSPEHEPTFVRRVDPLRGLVQKRRFDGFAGEVVISTDEEGRFTFLNAMPGEEHFVYGKIAGLAELGAVPCRSVRTPAHGGAVGVGDIVLGPGLELRGAVVRSDGEAIPAGTRVIVSRNEAWDSVILELEPDGSFACRGLPVERYSISVRVAGQHLSRQNWSLDVLNLGSLEGWLRESKTDLRVLLEPGDPDRSRRPDQATLQEYVRRLEQPLRGTEGG